MLKIRSLTIGMLAMLPGSVAAQSTGDPIVRAIAATPSVKAKGASWAALRASLPMVVWKAQTPKPMANPVLSYTHFMEGSVATSRGSYDVSAMGDSGKVIQVVFYNKTGEPESNISSIIAKSGTKINRIECAAPMMYLYQVGSGSSQTLLKTLYSGGARGSRTYEYTIYFSSGLLTDHEWDAAC